MPSDNQRGDFEFEQERHRRRMVMMNEMGKINRAETRLYWCWAIAGTLGFVAFVMAIVF